MSMHSFDPAIAVKVGVVPAVIYQNIMFWHARAVANGKHQHDGRTWVYNSVKAWGALFPYLTPKQIRGALEKLEEAGLVATGCYNQTPYDRTKWYCPLGQLDLPSGANEIAATGQPIPVSNPDINPDEDSPATAGTNGEGSAEPVKPTASRYRFAGRVIRLNEADFNRWQDSYQPLHLAAHLEELDAHLHSDATPAQRNSWFHYVSAILKKRATAERDKAAAPAKPASQRRSTVNAEPGKLYADLF